MARDAIARQSDVDKHSVKFVELSPSGKYRPGTITFVARKGKSLEIDKLRESLDATRLSGGTNMSMASLEITAVGVAAATDRHVVLRITGSAQSFRLSEAPGNKDGPGKETAIQRLRSSLATGEKVVTVTGQVQGWNGVFPRVLKALGDESVAGTPPVLHVTDFQIAKE